MSKYLIQVAYTSQGAKGVLEGGGSARVRAASDTVAQFGGTLEAFYFCFGPDDAALIVDVPDPAAMAAISLAVTASGALRTRATVLLTPEQIDEAAKMHVTYRAPGQ